MSVRLVYHLCILRDAIIHLAVAVVSVIRIVRGGKPTRTQTVESHQVLNIASRRAALWNTRYKL